MWIKFKIKKLSFWIFFNFFSLLRRFSQSKFHFDFEDDLPLGLRRLWLLIPLFAKNSRLGYFLNANNPQGEGDDPVSLTSFLNWIK